MPVRLRVYDTVERRWFETYAVNLAEIQASDPGRFNLDGAEALPKNATPEAEPEIEDEPEADEPEVARITFPNGKTIPVDWRERSKASRRIFAVVAGAPKDIKGDEANAYIEDALAKMEAASAKDAA